MHIAVLGMTVFAGVRAVDAIGTLTPVGNPGDDTQYTLNDIHARLTDFQNGIPASTTSSFVVPGSVSASFYTLTEIYDLISAEGGDLVPENIADGIEIFGVMGTLSSGSPAEYQSVDSTVSLCWDADANQISNGCAAGSGLLDPNGDGSLLLGATEYCQYLEEGGGSLAATPQNLWRLPTFAEAVNAGAIGDEPFSGFETDIRWTSTEHPDIPGDIVVILPNGYTSLNSKYTSNGPKAKCIRDLGVIQ